MTLYNLPIPKNGEKVKLFDMDGNEYEKEVKEAGALAKARDLFCFCAFTSLRYSDVVEVRKTDIHQGVMTITTQKTHDRLPIVLHKNALAILDKYKDEDFKNGKALPYITNQQMNRALKDLGEICGFNTPYTITCYRNGTRYDEVYPKYELIGTHTGRKDLHLLRPLQRRPAGRCDKVHRPLRLQINEAIHRHHRIRQARCHQPDGKSLRCQIAAEKLYLCKPNENQAMKELTLQEIETIVMRDENRIMEAKQTTGELAAGMQSGCAFLNTEGGWLFFGIHPKKLTILGQDVADQTRQDIANAFRKFSPAIDLSAQYVDVPNKPGKYVIAIYFKAPKAFEAPYTFDGRPWYKVENTTAQMPREMFDERIRLSDPEKFSWEKTMLPGATDKDISNKRLVDVINVGINKGRIPASAASLRSIDQRLDHFNLRTAEGYLTNAAVALFGKNPTRKISQCELKLARFEGTNMRVFRDQIVCEGNLFDQYDAILDFCRKHMFLSGTMDQKERIDTLTVPYKVIREAALNILIHRTWWSYGAVLSVAIFDDRVEFANPGAFPPGTSPETFYKRPQSKPINKLISEVFFKSGLMEAWGRGIPDIFDLCKENGLPKPEFELANGFVYLTIRFKQSLTPYLSGGVNDGEKGGVNALGESLKQVYDLIHGNPGIKANQIAERLGCSINTIEKQLSRLKEKSQIEYRGSAKTGGYYAK